MRIAVFILFSVLSTLASANGLPSSGAAAAEGTGSLTATAPVNQIGAAMAGDALQCDRSVVIENPETAKAITERAVSDVDEFANRLAELPGAAQASVTALAAAHALDQPLLNRAFFAKICERLAEKGIAAGELKPALQNLAQALGLAYPDQAVSGGETAAPAQAETDNASKASPAAAPGAESGLQTPRLSTDEPQVQAQAKTPAEMAAEPSAPLAVPSEAPAVPTGPTAPPSPAPAAEAEGAAPVPAPVGSAPALPQDPAAESVPSQSAQTPIAAPPDAAPPASAPSAPGGAAPEAAPEPAAERAMSPSAPEAPAAPAPPPAQVAEAPAPSAPEAAPSTPPDAAAPAAAVDPAAPPAQIAEAPAPSAPEPAPSTPPEAAAPAAPVAAVPPPAQIAEAPAPSAPEAAPSTSPEPAAPEVPAAPAPPPAQIAEAPTPSAPEPAPSTSPEPAAPEVPAAPEPAPAQIAEAPAPSAPETAPSTSPEPAAPEVPAPPAPPPAPIAEAPAPPAPGPAPAQIAEAPAPSAPETAPSTSPEPAAPEVPAPPAPPPAPIAEAPAPPAPEPAPAQIAEAPAPSAPEAAPSTPPEAAASEIPAVPAPPPAQVAEAPAQPPMVTPAPEPGAKPVASEPEKPRVKRPEGAVDKLGDEECRTLGVLDSCPDLNAVLDRLLERPLEYNYPGAMLLGRKTEITLVLRTDWEGKDLPAEVSEELKGLPGEVKQAFSKITRVMSAELTGREFDISPASRQERTVVPPQPVSWSWQVSPTDTGEKKPLKLRLYAHLQDGGGTMPPILVKTLDASINVDVTTWDWVVNQARTLEPIYAIGAALLGLLTAILTYFLTRRGEPVPQGGYREATGTRDSGPVIGDLGQSATDRRAAAPSGRPDAPAAPAGGPPIAPTKAEPPDGGGSA